MELDDNNQQEKIIEIQGALHSYLWMTGPSLMGNALEIKLEKVG